MKYAKLRVCASCEWIYRDNIQKDSTVYASPPCPKCGFGSYRARYVYGKLAYKYAKNQKPWKDKKMDSYSIKLDHEINVFNEKI